MTSEEAKKNVTPDRITDEIFNCFKYSNTTISRKQLIDRCMRAIIQDPLLLKDTGTASLSTWTKSTIGMVLDKIIADKRIKQDEDKILSIEKPSSEVKKEIQRDEAIKDIILEALKLNSFTKKDLQAYANKNRSEILKEVKLQALYSDLGRLLSVLVNNGTVAKQEGKYFLKDSSNSVQSEVIPKLKVSGGEVASANTEKQPVEEFKKLNPEQFVNTSIKLFETFYKSLGYTEVNGENIDGPNDGGIDGIIKAKDPLGYKESVIIQVKHSQKTHIKEIEIREFLGVFAAKTDATKGIFISNAKFTKETKAFAASYKGKYFLLVDGELLLEIAKKVNFNFE